MKHIKIALSIVAMSLAVPQLSFAISGSTISDAITSNAHIPSVSSSSSPAPAQPSSTTPVSTTTSSSSESSIMRNPATLIQDSAITAYIHTQLVITKGVPAGIEVTTSQGVVILEGTVDSKQQAHDVIKIALSASGVKVVDASRLKIKNV